MMYLMTINDSVLKSNLKKYEMDRELHTWMNSLFSAVKAEDDADVLQKLFGSDGPSGSLTLP